MNRRAFIKRGALFVPTIWVPSVVSAMNPAFLGSFKKPVSGGGGAFTYSAGVHATANSTSSATTSGINTTGVNLIVIEANWFSGSLTISDSKGNTWTASGSPLTQFQGSLGRYTTRFYYCVNPTVGTGHTFTGAASFVVINVMTFTKSSGTPTFDVQNGLNYTSANTTTIQSGSVAPAGNNELFILGTCFNNTGTTPLPVTADSSFISSDQSQQGTNNLYGAAWYKIQTTGGAENPTMTFAFTIDEASAAIATFK